jgi:hypothetical protein
VTYFVYRLTLISLAGDPDGQMLTGHATIGNGRLSGTPTVALTSHTPLLVSLLEHDGADPDAARRVYEVAGPSGLSAPAKPDGRKERARVSWRRDGR